MKELSRLLTILFIMINVIHSDEGLKRENLPVTIRDEAWTLVENIQKIKSLVVEVDTTRRDGRVTPNVKAQFILENIAVPKILIYSKDPHQPVQ